MRIYREYIITKDDKDKDNRLYTQIAKGMCKLCNANKIVGAYIVDININTTDKDEKFSATNKREFDLDNTESIPCDFNEKNLINLVADYANALDITSEDLPEGATTVTKDSMVFKRDDKSTKDPVIYLNRERGSMTNNLAIYVR